MLDRVRASVFSGALTFVVAASAPANAVILEYSSRPDFTAATGSSSIETFTDGIHFPIIGGVLNSHTTCPDCTGGPIPPGSIIDNITYSTEVFSNKGAYFNIDTGVNFAGGFLDSLGGFAGPLPHDPPRTLTVTFDALQRGFGFDTNLLMKTFKVDVFGDSDTLLGSFSYNIPDLGFDMRFFGFGSSAADIRFARIRGADPSINFAVDNFTFDATLPVGSSVPEPASWSLMLTGFGLAGAAVRRRRKILVSSA